MPARGGSLVNQALRASRIYLFGGQGPSGPVGGQWANGVVSSFLSPGQGPRAQRGPQSHHPPEFSTEDRSESNMASQPLAHWACGSRGDTQFGLGSVARHRKGTRVFHNHNVRVVPCFALPLVAEQLSRLWTLAASRVPGAGCDGLREKQLCFFSHTDISSPAAVPRLTSGFAAGERAGVPGFGLLR